MTWRLAKALETLRNEVNQLHPDRPKQSDGTIGDPRHQAEVSDHNPNSAGVVTAWDITTAPFTIALAETLRKMGTAGDQRVKYVIYRGRICSAKQDWAWRAYSGFSDHYDHIHLSVSADPAQYDRTDPWLTNVHAHDVHPPTPLDLEVDMHLINAGIHRPIAVLHPDGTIRAVKSNALRAAYLAAGATEHKITTDQYDLIAAEAAQIQKGTS